MFEDKTKIINFLKTVAMGIEIFAVQFFNSSLGRAFSILKKSAIQQRLN